MSDLMSPLNILTAINRIEKDLETLIGPEDWKRVGSKITAIIHRLRESDNQAEQEDLSDELIDIVRDFKSAQDRFRIELEIQAAFKEELAQDLRRITKESSDNKILETSIEAAHYAVDWSFNPGELPSPEAFRTRRISINPGGKKGGKSIKFSNLRLEFGEMSEIAGGAMLAGYAAIDKPHPLIIAASLLLTIRAVMKAMTVQVSEQDTSVFWGFIQARDRYNQALEGAILDITNQEREKYGLEPLSQLQLRNSLVNLESLKSVERIASKAGLWRIVENYTIQK